MQALIPMHNNKSALKLSLKSGAILLLLLLSIPIVACGSSTGNGTTNFNSPHVTVTIQLGNSKGSSVPSQLPYTCGAWATDTTPNLGVASVGVYAKFTQNVNGNPVGVGDATATATVKWPDGTTQPISAITTADGLAVFQVPVAGRPDVINKLTLVTVTFTKAGIPDCTIGDDRAAYFTLTGGGGAPPPNANGDTPPGIPTPTPPPHKKKH